MAEAIGHGGERIVGVRALAAWAGWAALAGCAAPADMGLVQPQLNGRQREVHLTSEQVFWAGGEGQERVLAEFPLPMARSGRPTYLLYLRWPADQKKLVADREPLPRIRGFLIQTRGEYAGLALVVSGTVEVRGSSGAGAASRQLRINLKCEDGSRVTGRLQARRDDWRLRQFETQRRPADVRAIQ